MYYTLIDETGRIYGKLTVKYLIKTQKDKKTMWYCECKCGSSIICSGSDLRMRRRTSCGKHCNNSINELGNKYGLLTVIERDPTPAIQFPDHSIHWLCHCDCGNPNLVSISGRSLRNGDTKSCGCLKSAGENMFSLILNELNIPYQKEYTFPDLMGPSGTNKLRFDFALFHENQLVCLIEYNGEQHEKEVPYFRHSLEYNQNNDELKRQYCMKHDIPLFTYTHIKGRLPNKEAVLEQIKNDYEEILNEVFN